MDYLKLKRGQSSPKVYINKKRKTEMDEVKNEETENHEYPNILVELEDEIQRQLEAKAEKSNLSVRNVKNILRNVLTNEDVLKLVDDNSERSIYDLKFTRAKTKQLLGQESHPIWQSGQKKSVAEILIHEEFPEDSSDEEYNPHEEHSDEETKVDEILDIVEEKFEPKSNKESIVHRTRSKLCLSETPLEIIEQAFIPPDITPDMYNTDCDNQDWLNFLKEFTQPLEPTLNETIDDDDPEYMFLMDEEQEAVTDKEELRVDRAVKVSKKELNELMTELFEYTQMHESDEEEVIKEKSEPEPIQEPIEQPIPQINPTIEKPQVNEIERRQVLLIKQQLHQHIQLALQQFILSYNHPHLDPSHSKEFKEMILKFDELRKTGKPIYKIKTLDSSLELIKNYEDANLDVERRNIARSKIPSPIMEFCLKSDAFPYPLLLPTYDFVQIDCQARFSVHEDRLIALFLYEKGLNEGITMSDEEFLRLSQEMHKTIIPVKSTELIFKHIKRTLKRRYDNPIKDLFIKGKLIEKMETMETKLLTDDEKMILEKQDARLVSEFVANKTEEDAKKNWDLFYKRNETKFFKDRHWTTREFIELAGLIKDEEKILLEIGCGVGNFIFPLIESGGNFKIYACDISPRAVSFVKSHPNFDPKRISVFEADITNDDSLKEVPLVDLVSLVFVLSAIHPQKFVSAIKNIHGVLKPGGILVFRDYGRYDMAQLRFKPGKKIADNLYLRQDGTRSYFFTVGELEELFEKNGFKKVINTYIHRRTVNLKENVDVPRIFVQSKFVKI